VIREDTAHRDPLHVAIEHDNRDLELAQPNDRLGIRLVQHRDDETVDTPPGEEPDVGGLHRRVAERVGEEHRVAVGVHRRLHAHDDLGEQRVRDVADDEADRERLAAPEALREQVGLVPESLDGRENAVAHGRADVGVSRHHP